MNVEVEIIEGLNPRLYTLVGPLVMNPEVLAYNNNYPFKTSETFLWFVALDNGAVCGFVPVKRLSEQWVVDNYYDHNNKDLLKILLRQIVLTCTADCKMIAVVQSVDRDLFSSFGFEVKVEWKRYFKMERPKDVNSKRRLDNGQA